MNNHILKAKSLLFVTFVVLISASVVTLTKSNPNSRRPKTALLAIFDRLMVIITLLASGTLLSVFLPVVNHAYQKQDRIIEKSSFPNEPVKITLVKTKKGVTKLGEKFSEDDDDWFKGLIVRVENISNKPINYISVMLVILRPKEQEAAGLHPFGEPLGYGISPFHSQDSPSKPVQAIAPGGSVELVLTDESFEENKNLLKRLGFSDSIKRIELSLQEVGFEDGTVWSGGELWKRDSDNPDKLIPLSQPNQWLLLSRASNKSLPVRTSTNSDADSGAITPQGLKFWL